MSSENETERPGFLARLWRGLIRILAALALFLLLAALLIGLGAAGVFGIQEFTTLTGKVSLLRADVNDLMAANQERQGDVVNLQTAAAGQLRRLDRLEEAAGTEEMAASLADQSAALADLESQLGALAAGDEGQAADLAALGTGLVALQSDINENGSRIDALGGQVDALQSDFESLSTNLGSVQLSVDELLIPNDELEPLRQALALFRIWDLVARARLHLAENNPGLATGDIELALSGVNTLLENATEDEVQQLDLIEMRLALALFNLTNDPGQAAADLDEVWNELDLLLTNQLFPDVLAVPADEGAQ